MKEPKILSSVAEFHRTFEHPIEKDPLIPAEKRCNLRVSLISEELQELEQAIKENNLIEVADALCDLQYVLAGAVLEFGLGDKFQELFEEVQRSNMSKACNTKEEAQATVDFYKDKEGVEAFIKEKDGKFLVFRASDNKTLKSVFYSPANLSNILNQ